MPNDMAQLGQIDFSSGYKPGDDFTNGTPNGFVRLDNLSMDETGVLILTRAPVAVNSTALSSGIYKIFSTILNSIRVRFAQLIDNSVVYDTGSGSFSNIFLPGFSPNITIPAAIGQGFGTVFGMNHAGGPGKETDGVNVYNWGLSAVTIKRIYAFNQAVSFPFYGTDANSFTSFVASGATIVQSDEGIITITSSGNCTLTYTPGTALNLNVSTLSSDAGLDTDVFYLAVYSVVTQKGGAYIQVVAQTSAGNQYQFQWGYAEYQQSYNSAPGWFVLSTPRGSFGKVGTPSWANITKVQIVITSTQTASYTFSVPFEFYNSNNAGGTLNAGITLDQTKYGVQLTDPYTYASQSQWDNNQYSGLSPLGFYPSNSNYIGRPIWGKWSSLKVQINTPVTDARITAVNIFKNGGTLGGDYILMNTLLAPFTAGSRDSLLDSGQDRSYLANVGTNTEGNLFLVSPNTICQNAPITIIGPINGRMLFCDTNNVYISDYLNPEAFDTRLTVKLSGNNNEIILSATITTQNVALILTNIDIYQISGTMQFLADGTFDIYVLSQGIHQPPISQGLAMIDNSVMWVAKDGLRQTFVSLVSQISADLNQFFRGQSCHGVPGFLIQSFISSRQFSEYFQLAVAKQKIYLLAAHLDGTNSMFVYDLKHKAWRRRLDPVQPLCMFSEQDDTLLCGYPDGFIRNYNSSGNLFDGSQNQSITLRTTLKDGGEANTRKDLFTLKLLFTSASALSFSLLNESGTTIAIGNLSSNNAKEPTMNAFPVNGLSIDQSRKYALQITGATSYFKFAGWYLDVYRHPEPQAFYREPTTNFGYNGAKKVTTIPIVIDCLGNNVTMQPIVDGANVNPPAIFSGNGKKTYYYNFNPEVTGIDYSYTLYANGALFEPYGAMEPIEVEKLPPPKLADQIGPIVLDKRGKLYGFRVRMMSGTPTINYSIIFDDVVVNTGSFPTTAGVDTTYEINRLPKTLVGNVLRIEFKSPDGSTPFYRWSGLIRVTVSGMKSSQRWLPIETNV